LRVPCAADDIEALAWVLLSGPLPDIAFEPDVYIIERYRQTGLEEGLPVDPDFADQGHYIPLKDRLGA